MPRLDPAIDQMFKTPDSELQLSTGLGIQLKTPAGTKSIVRQPLTTQQIVAAMTEILPADLRGSFPQGGVTRFPYLAPAGPVLVKVDYGGQKAQATITRYTKQEPAEVEDRFPPDEDEEPLE